MTTAWYDVAAGTSVSSEALLADGVTEEVVTRVLQAGEADSRVDAQRLADELATDAQEFDALAFSTDGQGQRPVLLRPPYGTTSDTVAGVAAELGMAQVLWNVDPEDWKDRDSAIVQERVLAATGPGDIVLSHDIHETTRDAYPAIIDQLQADGYVLVTVPELLGTALQPGQRLSSQ